MLGNYFSASGPTFDVDSFLESGDFRHRVVFYRGQQTGLRDKTCKVSGFSVTLNPDFGELRPQIRAALRFLKKHRKPLKRLATHPRVSHRRITFTFCPGNRMCYEEFPSELLLLAGSLRIGFAVSFYPGRRPPSTRAQRHTPHPTLTHLKTIKKKRTTP